MTKKQLTLLVVVLLLVLAAKRAKSQRQAAWHGLSETEARAKLDQKLSARIPDDKRQIVTDKIVGTMRDRGILAEDLEPSSTSAAGESDADGTDENPEQTANAANDEIIDLTDSVTEAAKALDN